jgi:hypothetical protein
LPPVDTSNIRSTMSPNNATPPIPSNTKYYSSSHNVN